MKEKVLGILKSNKGYVSGQEMCDRLQVSRTAIWKVMNQLKEEGYEIDSVKNKGYLLKSSPDLLTDAEVSGFLTTNVFGRNLKCMEAVDSTNEEIKRMAAQGAPHGTLVVSDCQLAGKGRRGRAWVSDPGENIYMSMLLKPDMNPGNASMVTLVAGLSVAKACREMFRKMGCSEEIGIKWPNDIVWQGKKLVGILTEMSMEMDAIHYLVPGIGINVNAEHFPEEIADKAASLRIAAGAPIHRAELVALCMKYFEQDYTEFLKTQDMSGLIDSYCELLVNKDREVCVLDPKGEFTGIARGINNEGELLVETADGMKVVYAGEVSVRGIYGYV